MNDRNDWQIVQQAPPPYAKCAISGFGDGPFVDFGVRMNAIDPNLCINVDVLRDAARFVGMYDAAEYQHVADERDRLAAEVAVLHAECAELEKFKESIDFIGSKDFITRKKAGRPKQKVEG